MGSDWGNPEKDVILVPTSSGYQQYSVLNLLGISARQLQSTRGFGLAPLHFISQRGPQQDGSTPLDIRLDDRVIQILISDQFTTRTDFWDRRNELLDLLRPTRSFNGTVRPLIYRKWLPAGKTEQGSDGVADGTTTFLSNYGRFITRGGLQANDTITIAGVVYVIAQVPNDYTIITTVVVPVGVGLEWSYRRRASKRDLYCLLERGPTFDDDEGPEPFYPTGYREALRLRAHDPAWYSDIELYETWTLPDSLGDLVFDGFGAWLGPVHGVGRWLFSDSGIGETINVVYWGTDPAVPVIEISGLAQNPRITNNTTSASILLNYTVAAGETVTIDLLALTVTNNLGTNLFRYAEGDLSSFTLECEPQAPNRINVISVTIPVADGTTNVTLKWKNRFIGI